MSATPEPASPTPSATPEPASPTPIPHGVTPEWEGTVARLTWVAYSPPSADPDKNLEATPDAIREDLVVLRSAGFTGLVTYSSTGVLGRELPRLAQEQGFQGLIIGVWDPTSQEEITDAQAVAALPIVLGYCIGNEGLGDRYQLDVLSKAIDDMHTATGKPVTTTEQIDDYTDTNLLQIGDWIFPNVHPYFHNKLDPDAAVRWTQAAYDDLKRRTQRFVMFKEVGLPTAGDQASQLSEANQAQYYRALAQTNVRFVYFEGFDQPWKTQLPVEPHWGIFYSDRTPKLLGWQLMGKEPPATPGPVETFYIYRDADFADNHYKPTGYMGDIGDIQINEVSEDNPHSGTTAIRIVYSAQGQGQNECPYGPPCKWAGVYWQEPPNNWGKDAVWGGKGFDLSKYSRLAFWARADKPCAVEFAVGGIDQPYGDSLKTPRKIAVNLKQDWQEYTIDLKGADLKHIIGGFSWVANWTSCSGGTTFYLDDIRFEG
jgi:exo-beta-1,3-glucanase (GH17 family)